MEAIKFVSMPTETARAFQAGAPDANGQTPERHVSDGAGVPCRHCQRDVGKGKEFLALAYRPFPAPQPFAEVGPVFLCADACTAYPQTPETPDMFLKRESYLLKGYGEDDRIAYGTGRIVPPAGIPEAAAQILARDGVDYVHVRSALNNCYQARIDRA